MIYKSLLRFSFPQPLFISLILTFSDCFNTLRYEHTLSLVSCISTNFPVKTTYLVFPERKGKKKILTTILRYRPPCPRVRPRRIILAGSSPRRNPMKVAGPVVGKLHLHEHERSTPCCEEKSLTIATVSSDYFFDNWITLKFLLKLRKTLIFYFPLSQIPNKSFPV